MESISSFFSYVSNKEIESNKSNITYSDYSLLDNFSFFGGTDPIRIVILFYILFSFILNIIIIISVSLTKKKRYSSLALTITGSILFVNFVHTFSYLFEWVIKEGVEIEINDNITVGGLLIGNLNNFSPCIIQGFLLISSSISQDFLINIFYYVINMKEKPQQKYVLLALLLLGFLFPIVFTSVLYFIDGLGLNDEFCYVKKFQFTCDKNTGICKYENYQNFHILVLLVYLIRTLNFIFAVYRLWQIIKYIRKENLAIKYIVRSSAILFVQLFTLGIGLIYRISSFFKDNFSANLSGIYLILNTCDGVLFPLCYSLSNNIYSNLWKILTGKKEEEEDDDSSEPEIDLDDSLSSFKELN